MKIEMGFIGGDELGQMFPISIPIYRACILYLYPFMVIWAVGLFFQVTHL